MKTEHIVAMMLGIPTFVWLIFLVGWEIALAIFLLMYANNLSQVK